ncbi:MAG: hypothetical protein ACD_75C00445G0001 [uncultured bacterium]|nr:MAG: hypothetical protein ACD_75C00445G0001 [uncultured bacterium]
MAAGMFDVFPQCAKRLFKMQRRAQPDDATLVGQNRHESETKTRDHQRNREEVSGIQFARSPPPPYRQKHLMEPECGHKNGQDRGMNIGVGQDDQQNGKDKNLLFPLWKNGGDQEEQQHADAVIPGHYRVFVQRQEGEEEQ